MRIFTLGMILKEIKDYFPDLKFWDGTNSHEPFNPKHSYKHRQGMPNEIRIEFDSEIKEQNWNDAVETCCNLWKEGYSFALFFVEGGRSPHIHLYNIDELENLTKEKRIKYRKLFLRKVCPPESKVDLNLCDETHLCALEFVNHFKYGKPKALLHYFWQGKNQGCDYDLKIKADDEETKRIELVQQNIEFFSKAYNPNLSFKQKVEAALTFEKVFDKYGIKYKGKMALCPFHNDTNYSLSFTNEKKMFHCFSCNAKGKIISLIKLLESQKRQNGKKSNNK